MRTMLFLLASSIIGHAWSAYQGGQCVATPVVHLITSSGTQLIPTHSWGMKELTIPAGSSLRISYQTTGTCSGGVTPVWTMDGVEMPYVHPGSVITRSGLYGMWFPASDLWFTWYWKVNVVDHVAWDRTYGPTEQITPQSTGELPEVTALPGTYVAAEPGLLHIVHTVEADVTYDLLLTSVSGAIQLRRSLMMTSGENRIQVPIRDVARGVHFVTLVRNEEKHVLRLVIP